ncbi:glucose-1-phosphate cytidylyltransferase [Georgenia alba]|uniref:Glucose-1-phosphate cytidylyltransferase n=1 Tax=Georgenia alba TaxID=2233858 RepID=A0ABW2Q658_9MICO
MKVVLFCGGYGMRMRGGSEDRIPKPMQLVGPMPLLWHVMSYYAHHGHTEFVLCLGYGAEHITRFFLEHNETTSNDFVLRRGEVELTSTDISDWTIHFVHTGLESTLNQRLLAVRDLLAGEELFLANYADVLCNAPLEPMLERFAAHPDALLSMLAVPPQQSFHVLGVGEDGTTVTDVTPVSQMPLRENGGYLIMRPGIFDWLRPEEDMMEDTCPRLAERGLLMAQPYDGFWKPADTFKERAELDRLWSSGERPWALPGQR